MGASTHLGPGLRNAAPMRSREVYRLEGWEGHFLTAT
jgi:hypothetical protein